MLIENYQNFAALDKKVRFKYLAELVGGGKTYKDCYNRAKLLKLKKGSIEQAKEISSGLLAKANSEDKSGLKDRLVKQALEQLARTLGERNGDGKVHISVITEMVEYLRQI